MKEVLLGIMLLISFESFGQMDVVGDVIDTGIQTTDLILEVNDAVSMITQMERKRELLKTQMDQLQAILDNPRSQKYINAQDRQGAIARIQLYNMKVNIYGNAINYTLKAVRQGLSQFTTAVVTKTTAAVSDKVQSVTDEASEKSSAVSGTTNLSGTKRKIAWISSDSELRSKMLEIQASIKKVMPRLIDINSKLDEISSDVSALSFALSGTVGMQIMFFLALPAKHMNEVKPKTKN